MGKEKLKLIRRSYIWSQFTEYGRDRAKCGICGKILSIRGGNTSNLRRHAAAKHKKKSSNKSGQLESDEDSKSGEKKDDGVVIVENCNGESLPNEILINEGDTGQAKNKVIRRSPIWKYFTKSGRDMSKCSLCNESISHKGGSTSNLRRHIRAKHKKVIIDENEIYPINPVSKTDVDNLNVAGEVIIIQGDSGETELLFQDYAGNQPNEETLNQRVWKDESSRRKPNILRKQSSRLRTKKVRVITDDETTSDDDEEYETNFRYSQDNSYRDAAVDGLQQKKNDSNTKSEALMDIAHNLGRIASAFEKIADVMCRGDNIHGENNEQISSNFSNKINELISKVVGQCPSD